MPPSTALTSFWDDPDLLDGAALDLERAARAYRDRAGDLRGDQHIFELLHVFDPEVPLPDALAVLSRISARINAQ